MAHNKNSTGYRFMIVKIPYGREGKMNPPYMNAIKISRTLQADYGLTHEKDYTWHFDTKAHLFIISLNEEHESLASIIAMRYLGQDLYEI